MERPDEERYFQMARDLIDAHDEGVASFLEAKLNAVMDARDYDAILEWSAIRNAVALSLDGNTTRQ